MEIMETNFALEELVTDNELEQWPYVYYKRFVTNGREPLKFLEPLDFGYGFLLIDLRSKWEDDIDQSAIMPKLNIEFTKIIGAKKLQISPYNLANYSTPGHSGVNAVAAPLPVDNNGFNINFTATPVKDNIRYNEFYLSRENIDIDLNFLGNVLVQERQFYIDLCLVGYLVPNETLDVWGG